MHLTRYSMYRQIQAALKEPLTGRVLGVSGIENFRSMISSDADVVETMYPDVDIENLKFSDGEFDCVITDQVLEHLPHPLRAPPDQDVAVHGRVEVERAQRLRARDDLPYRTPLSM